MTDRGIEGTSVDEIAQVSGVSKATIYKHWQSKDVLCIEAISRLKCDLPVFDSGHPRADAAALLRHLAQTKNAKRLRRLGKTALVDATDVYRIKQNLPFSNR